MQITNFHITSDLIEIIRYDTNTYQHLPRFGSKFEYSKCHNHT